MLHLLLFVKHAPSLAIQRFSSSLGVKVVNVVFLFYNLGGNGLEYGWKEPDIYLGEVLGTSCTSFTHGTHGTSILVTGRNMWFLY